MNEYRYVAARSDGTIIKGRSTSASVTALKKELRSNQLFLIKTDVIAPPKHRRLNAEKLSEFCRSFSSLLSAGVPAAKALDIIAARETDHSVKGSYRYLISLIESGEGISASMQKTEGMFPNLLVVMAEVGECGGKLDKSMARMAEYYERLHCIRSEVHAAMAYPLMLFAITILVVVTIFTFIFPMFSELFYGMELPQLTKTMMAVSEIFTKHLWLVLIITAAVITVGWWLSGLPRIRRFVSKAKYHVPFVGRLFRIMSTSDFARVLAALYSGGLPILQALGMAGSSCGTYISSQFTAVVSRVRSGVSISSALSDVDGLDIKLWRSVAVGEASGKLDELLEKLSGSLEHEASTAIRKLLRFVEPVMIFFSAALILLVVLSVMTPIYGMYNHIGAGL